MAEQSPRMEWAFPSREDDPWYDAFRDFVIAVDGSGFAHREDRSIIWSGGGTVSWDLATQTFAWTDWINIFSPMSGKLMRIEAGSITDWAEGEIVYVSLTRLALENVTKAFSKATAMPSNDDVMAFGFRINDTIFLRTGISLGDGDTAAGIAPVPGGGLATEDEGASVDPATTTMDFVGGNITATQTAPGRVQVAVTGGAASPFEVDLPNNEIQPTIANIGRSFIVGSQQMDDSGAAQDERMFFDKATGAFRAGTATSTQWDAVNRGDYSTAFGRNCRATSPMAFAECSGTQANGWYSHAEGGDTVADGDAAHAEGLDTLAEGYHSHAEGDSTWAAGENAHAEGLFTRAEGYNSHTEGWGSRAVGRAGHAEGRNTYTSGYDAHAEGNNTRAYGDYSHAEGVATEATAAADGAHVEGLNTYASARYAHAEGDNTQATSRAAHAEGQYTTAAGSKGAHAEGYSSQVTTGRACHAEGYGSQCNGSADYGTHAEGNYTTASHGAAHSEGSGTTASGYASHAEGDNSDALGRSSHAEGADCTATSQSSHAEGEDAESYFHGSHAASSGRLSTAVHSQYQRITVGRFIFPATIWGAPLQTVGNNGTIVVPLDHSWVVDIEVVGRDGELAFLGGSTGDTATFFFKAALANKAGVVAFVGGASPWTWIHSFRDPGALLWDARLVIGATTPNALEIEILGDVSRATLWEATIHITEIEAEAGPP